MPDEVGSFKRVRMAFAWASGNFAIPEILDRWADSGSWVGATKQALIGIDQGITSPVALTTLRDAGFEVRVPMLSDTLANDWLRSPRLFHTKAICFDSGKSEPFGLLVGSANLTDQGMGAGERANIELASIVIGRGVIERFFRNAHKDHLDGFDEWWESAWEDAERLTDEALEAYEVARARIKESKAAFEAEHEETEAPADVPDDSDDAFTIPPTGMWIELPYVDKEIDPDGARSLSGGSKSQIDIPHKAALKFFGVRPSEHFSEEIELNYGSVTAWKKADFRADLGLNKQLRLNLITKDKGGPNYENTVLVMENLSQDPTRISYDVVPIDSASHRKLLQLSKNAGELRRTFGKSPRQWGLF
jgi:hypothetical protein